MGGGALSSNVTQLSGVSRPKMAAGNVLKTWWSLPKIRRSEEVRKRSTVNLVAKSETGPHIPPIGIL